MLKTVLIALLPLLVLFGYGTNKMITGSGEKPRSADTGTLEKMIVSNGSATLDLDMNRIAKSGRGAKAPQMNSLRFDVENDTYFTVIVFNNELRGPLPSSMPIIPKSAAALPGTLNRSYSQLVVENTFPGSPYEYVIRDAKSGYVFFNIEGHEYDYDANQHLLSIRGGRVLLSNEYAKELGRPADTGTIVGEINISATMRAIEVAQVVNGEVANEVLPADPLNGTTPGPDVIVGDLNGLAQFGSASGTQVGLAVGTDSCNAGTVDLHWFALPDNDHPVIPQNLYRMSGGASNDERFEQIGQSQMKHAFTALTQNLCGFGCNGVGGANLGSGCSDPYSASLNSGPSLGSRAWVNPFTGFFPRGDAATPPNNHAGHTHTGPSHRILTEINDLSTALNPGAKYFAEAQYITKHEYDWCQTNPTQCNMYNNVSYRQYSVNGTASPFSFTPVTTTQRSKRAITAWTGATLAEFKPAPGVDGVGVVGYKVTNPSPGVWHYEYAVYNENLDRAIQSFSIPVGGGVTLTNVGFKSPPQHPGWSADGTVGNAGYSSTPWPSTQAGGSITWATETFAQNQNANAIRWGTLYNFRFDSNRPPTNVNATIGFFKTGSPIQVAVQGPSAPAANVTISGRVVNQNGTGVRNAIVTLTDVGPSTRRSVMTNPFGYYSFENVLTGSTYTVSVLSKTFTFTSQNITPTGDLTNVDFTALP